jgi:hypothetical protein
MLRKRFFQSSLTFLQFFRISREGQVAQLVLSSLGLSFIVGLTIGCNSTANNNGNNGGGGGGSTPQIVISVTNSSPTALTPLYVTTSGLDTTRAFTVTLSISGNSVTLSPLRTQSDGTVVLATPLYIDPTTGSTSSVSASMTISQQGSTTSSPLALNIQDIPQNSDYGTSLGQISRAFYDYQQISMGAMQNAFQAIQGAPSNSVDTTAIRGHIATQLNNAILARDDVDRIVTNNAAQLGIGTLPNGTSISFNSVSVEIMDRLIGSYLTAMQPEISPAVRAAQRRRHDSATGHLLSGINGSGQLSGRGTYSKRHITANPRGFISSALPYLGTLGAGATIVNALRTDWKSDSTVADRLIASEAGAFAGMYIYGTIATALGVAGAPAIVAAAGTAGLVIGIAAIANDIYKAATAPSNILADTNSGSSPSTLTAAQQAMASPTGALVLDSVGGILAALTKDPAPGTVGFLTQEGTQLGIQAAGLLNSTLQLIGSFAPADLSTAQNAAAQFQSPYPSASQGFGNVSSTVSISNSAGPTLSGLTGMLIYDSSSGIQLNSMADENGNYDVVVPLGSTTINYSNTAIYAYDPITTLSSGSYFILSSTYINLSGLTSNQALPGPALSGTCNDPDANAYPPDADDPDCD